MAQDKNTIDLNNGARSNDSRELTPLVVKHKTIKHKKSTPDQILNDIKVEIKKATKGKVAVTPEASVAIITLITESLSTLEITDAEQLIILNYLFSYQIEMKTETWLLGFLKSTKITTTPLYYLPELIKNKFSQKYQYPFKRSKINTQFAQVIDELIQDYIAIKAPLKTLNIKFFQDLIQNNSSFAMKLSDKAKLYLLKVIVLKILNIDVNNITLFMSPNALAGEYQIDDKTAEYNFLEGLHRAAIKEASIDNLDEIIKPVTNTVVQEINDVSTISASSNLLSEDAAYLSMPVQDIVCDTHKHETQEVKAIAVELVSDLPNVPDNAEAKAPFNETSIGSDLKHYSASENVIQSELVLAQPAEDSATLDDKWEQKQLEAESKDDNNFHKSDLQYSVLSTSMQDIVCDAHKHEAQGVKTSAMESVSDLPNISDNAEAKALFNETSVVGDLKPLSTSSVNVVQIELISAQSAENNITLDNKWEQIAKQGQLEAESKDDDNFHKSDLQHSVAINSFKDKNNEWCNELSNEMYQLREQVQTNLDFCYSEITNKLVEIFGQTNEKERLIKSIASDIKENPDNQNKTEDNQDKIKEIAKKWWDHPIIHFFLPPLKQYYAKRCTKIAEVFNALKNISSFLNVEQFEAIYSNLSIELLKLRNANDIDCANVIIAEVKKCTKLIRKKVEVALPLVNLADQEESLQKTKGSNDNYNLFREAVFNALTSIDSKIDSIKNAIKDWLSRNAEPTEKSAGISFFKERSTLHVKNPTEQSEAEVPANIKIGRRFGRNNNLN